MNSGIIIALLAAFTIGITFVGAIIHFGFHLRDPKNLEAAKTVAKDRESATTAVSSNQGTPNKPLLQRLNESKASNDGIGLFTRTPSRCRYRENLEPHLR